MRINHNLMAMNTHRQLGVNSANAEKNVGKLSSGLRINSAADDAAGLAISEKMRGQIRGLTQASRNSQDGISMIQTAEGALNETHSILQRMKELSTQAANDTNTETDRSEIQKEMNQLTSEINRIGNNTEFNTQNLLNGEKEVSTATAAATIGTAGVSINGSKSTGTINVAFAAGTASQTSISSAWSGSTLTITVGSAAGSITADELDTAISNATGTVPNNGAELDVEFTGNIAAASLKAAGTMNITGGGTGGVNLQIGANQSQTFNVDISDMRGSALGISGSSGVTATGANAGVAVTGASFASTDSLTDNSGTTEYALDVSDSDKASAAIKVLDQAIESVSGERSKLGAFQNRLDHTIKNLDTSSENLQAAESRIRDVDMAKEMMEFTKNNILSQAAQSMLSQANQQPQGVLQLLR